MLWESDSQRQIPQAQGMRWSVSRCRPQKASSTESYLMHYGVPGMKWGVITQEYIKKGRRLFGVNSRAQNKKERSEAYKEGYQIGVRRANRTDFIRKREEKIRKQWEKDHPKPDIVDRLVRKGMDKYGLGQYSDTVSKKLKDTAQNKAIDFLKSEKGQATAQKGANTAAKSLSWLLNKSAPGAQRAADALRKLPVRSLKAIPRGAKRANQLIISASNTTVRWLRSGGLQRMHRGAAKMAQLASRYGSTAMSYFEKGMLGAEKLGHHGISSAYKIADAGAKALQQLMRRRR